LTVIDVVLKLNIAKRRILREYSQIFQLCVSGYGIIVRFLQTQISDIQSDSEPRKYEPSMARILRCFPEHQFKSSEMREYHWDGVQQARIKSRSLVEELL
jgi:hypothetical protein